MAESVLLNNRYKLEDPLGSGGMATVYRAQDLMLERPIAIKVLRADYSKDPAFRERFRQEAKAAANLSHSNIVTVHDFGLDQNRLFIGAIVVVRRIKERALGTSSAIETTPELFPPVLLSLRQLTEIGDDTMA